eukprot:1759961-Amphidinium_carterae.1
MHFGYHSPRTALALALFFLAGYSKAVLEILVQSFRGAGARATAEAPLAAEWAEFCASGGFQIAEFASSDLLAGTEFESAVFLL